MGLFDDITCEYPLPNLSHQDRAFQTKDLGCWLHRYVITRDGRLIRKARTGVWGEGSPRDMEWPIHGDIQMYDFDRDRDQMVEYVVRFTHGRVEWILSAADATAAARDRVPANSALAEATIAGRALTADEFAAHVPKKLELVDGRIAGGEELLVLLLGAVGLGRAIELVGADRWREALAVRPE